jgi:TolB-like protein/tetratricopeptide (TPR) repeat protein
LSLDQLLHMAIPVVDAVSYAHQKGIVHRDLKPGNIMLDEEGRPKVLDFGLAKLLESPVTPDETTVVVDGSISREGSILGTASYMSPEQAEGKPTDARSDIFSLGIILYEMATGQRPFKGDTAMATISSILKDTPPSVTELNRSLPSHLARVVNRCLAKDPARRYQVGQDLRIELEGLREESSHREADAPVRPGLREGTAPAAESMPPSAASGESAGGSVPSQPRRWKPLLALGGILVAAVAILGIWRPWSASKDATSPGTGQGDQAGVSERSATKRVRLMAVVFPFENLGPAEDAYFAAGVTEEISSRLAAVSGLGIISRTSATQYDRSGKTMKQIREDLGVDYVLEGTVRWARTADGSDRVRITPQLSHVADDRTVWSETYDREIHDIFEVQSDIASQVIAKLGVTLLGAEQERLEARPTESIEAYEAYLEAGKFEGYAWVMGDQEIVALYERAIALDPEFLGAWVALCTHHLLYYSLIEHTDQRLSRAESALRGAEAVDPDDPWTRWARGFFYYHGARDYDRALVEFTVAAKCLPNDVTAQSSIGWILRRQGKLAECIEILENTLALDPRHVDLINDLGTSYQGLRNFTKAAEYYQRGLAIDPANDTIRTAAFFNALSATGDLEEARQLLREEPGDNPFYHIFAWYTAYALGNEWAKALALVEPDETRRPIMRMLNSYGFGVARLGLGEEAAARRDFETAAQIGEQLLTDSPGDVGLHEITSLTHARLGRREDAIREAKTAVELSAKDLFSGPRSQENLARVYVITGDLDDALDLVDFLLGTHYDQPLTTHILQIDSFWEPLRDHPRYQEVLRKYGWVG